MFFAGVYINDETGVASIVVFEKVLKSARKIYLVKDVRKYPAGTSTNMIIAEATLIMDDSRFLRKKKVFSQNNRPPKNVCKPPVIVVGFKNGLNEINDEFRENKIAVERIVFHDAHGWKKEALPILRYGNNYYVNPFDIFAKISASYTDNRISYERDGHFSEDIQLKLEESSEESGKKLNFFELKGWEALAALSLPIWYCETVRQITRY